MSTSRRGRIAVVAVAAAAVWVLVPLRVSDYWLAVLDLAGIAAIGATGLNLLTGSTGQLSLGHAAFVGAGAYACAALGPSHLPYGVAVVAGAAVGAVVGLAVSPFARRLRSHNLAVVTLALVFIAQWVFRRWTSVTGGTAGRTGLAAPSLPGTHEQGWFWLVWALVAATTVLAAAVGRSRLGRAMVAVRTDEQAAAVMGIDVAATKVAAFVIAGALAGVAGALYGSYKQFVGPDDWSLLLSIQYLAMILIGGAGTVRGPVIGALFVTALPRLVESVVHTSPGSAVTDAQLSQLAFGLLVVAVVIGRARWSDRRAM